MQTRLYAVSLCTASVLYQTSIAPFPQFGINNQLWNLSDIAFDVSTQGEVWNLSTLSGFHVHHQHVCPVYIDKVQVYDDDKFVDSFQNTFDANTVKAEWIRNMAGLERETFYVPRGLWISHCFTRSTVAECVSVKLSFIAILKIMEILE